MTKQPYTIQQNTTVLELAIPSSKSLAWKIAIIFQTVIFFGLIIASILIIINDFSWAALLLGGLLILTSIFFIKTNLDTYFWIQHGQEFLKIDLTTDTFIYQKIGRTVFDEISGSIANLSEFKSCSENNDYIDMHPRAGTKGGKICFWVKEKRVRFGISLSKPAAQNCISELNSFLTQKKQQ